MMFKVIFMQRSSNSLTIHTEDLASLGFPEQTYVRIFTECGLFVKFTPSCKRESGWIIPPKVVKYAEEFYRGRVL